MPKESLPELEYPEIIIQLDDNPAVAFSRELSRAAWSIAFRNDITIEQSIAVAVMNQKFLEDLVDDGGELFIKRGRKWNRLEFC